MKRILIILSFFVCLVAKSQTVPFPVKQTVGAPKVLTNTMGGAQIDVGTIFGNYADTTAANLNSYIKYYAGAKIRTHGDVIWIRNRTATRWLPFGGATTNVFASTITMTTNNIVSICNAIGACQTFTIAHTLTSTVVNVYFIDSSTIKICNAFGACQTVTVVTQNLDIFQNGTQRIAQGIVEYGGLLLHNTTLNSQYYVMDFTGYPVYQYPYKFSQTQYFENGTGISSWRSRGASTNTEPDFENTVSLGVNYTGKVYGASPSNLTGYFNDKIGYFVGTNLTGAGSFGLSVQNQNSKYSGIFYHTLDVGTDALTFYGDAAPLSTYVGEIASGGSLENKRFATFHTDKLFQLYGYSSAGFRRVDSTNYKPLVVDAEGKVYQGHWFGSGGGSGVLNANVGAGYRILKPASQEVKTISAGISITVDSTSNTDGLTVNFDPSARINTQAGTTYTLVASDNGKMIDCTSSSAVSVTVASGLPAGFNCIIRQLGTGQVTITPAGGVTINNRQSYTKTAGRYASATLTQVSGNTYTTQGDMQ